ncbi:DNA repair protein RecN [Roseburia sp. BX1005]|uniref:DNA repair protein RecN n=1 Tax=Roseburia zhanii TaxID=2763064 RepID=A0A923RT84_9FIRM|nr:DNA repair protein RecN [Roseburia zhanii]MBC5713590.1 DNA repair protein RecN [Roseburia zhanii]
MLQSLHVKNLALIDEAEVDLTSGLNIMTGETGAGKSIIIGSINIALGEKVPKEMIRDNADYGLVELTFFVESERVKKALADLEIELEDDCLIISRKIINGRSISKINAETVPVSKVRQAAALLIDIHGQHEHQSLLVKKNHIHILDEYAKQDLKDEKEQLKEAYTVYKALKKELEEANTDTSEREREISFLSYEVDEIEEAQLMAGEDEQLEQEYKWLVNGQKILEAASGAYEKTAEGFESATEQISYALKNLSSVSEYDEQLADFESQLSEIDNLLNDFNRELASYLADTTFDEQTFTEVENRLNVINHLKTKYGSTIEEIVTACKEKKERLEKLADYDTYLADLKQRFADSEKKLEQHSEKVSKIRKKSAEELTEAIRKQLMDLNFLDVSFSMQFQRTDSFTANGFDDAEFMISTNPGEPQKSLEKIASGGELSRIMLAIKSVSADADAVGTLIFDEIDTGISGRTAQMVSEKMNALGRNHQIICITHLPQIAAMSDSHYLIEKSVSNQTTISTIRPLDQDESINELARMLGGVKITKMVLENAREMKELAANTKKSLGEEK